MGKTRDWTPNPKSERNQTVKDVERISRDVVRVEISNVLLEKLAEHFCEGDHGRIAIERLFEDSPKEYLKLIASLVPRTNVLQGSTGRGFIDVLSSAHAELKSLPPTQGTVNADDQEIANGEPEQQKERGEDEPGRAEGVATGTHEARSEVKSTKAGTTRGRRQTTVRQRGRNPKATPRAGKTKSRARGTRAKE